MEVPRILEKCQVFHPWKLLLKTMKTCKELFQILVRLLYEIYNIFFKGKKLQEINFKNSSNGV